MSKSKELAEQAAVSRLKDHRLEWEASVVTNLDGLVDRAREALSSNGRFVLEVETSQSRLDIFGVRVEVVTTTKKRTLVLNPLSVVDSLGHTISLRAYRVLANVEYPDMDKRLLMYDISISATSGKVVIEEDQF